MIQEIFCFIYDEALKEYESSEYHIINKLKFLTIALRLFAEIKGEDACIEIRTLAVIFNFRLDSRTFWVCEMPEIEEKLLFIEYLSTEINIY